MTFFISKRFKYQKITIPVIPKAAQPARLLFAVVIISI